MHRGITAVAADRCDPAGVVDGGSQRHSDELRFWSVSLDQVVEVMHAAASIPKDGIGVIFVGDGSDDVTAAIDVKRLADFLPAGQVAQIHHAVCGVPDECMVAITERAEADYFARSLSRLAPEYPLPSGRLPIARMPLCLSQM